MEERLMLSGQRNGCGLFHFTGTFELLPKAIWLVTLKWKQTFVTDPKTHSDYKIHGEQYNWARKVRPASFWICVLAFILCMLVVLKKMEAAAPSWSKVMTKLLSLLKMPLDIGTVTGIYTFFKQCPHHDENEQIKDMWRIIEHFLDSVTWKVMMI